MRKTTGSVKKIKICGKQKWQMRMTYTDPETGSRKDIKRLFDSQTEASQSLWRELAQHQKRGTVEKITHQMTFAEAATRYSATKLIPAAYQGSGFWNWRAQAGFLAHADYKPS